MKFIIATFDHTYYLWQSLVQINNFMKFGYDVDLEYIISTDDPSPVLQSFMNNDKIKAKFHIYKDTRETRNYASSLRPHILEKFFKDYPEYENEVLFYTDPDVLFTKKMDFTNLCADKVWYVSDTRSYLDSNYVKSKGVELFNEMCAICKVDPEVITANDPNAGGAQYIMKGVNAEFWRKVYLDSEELYVHMQNTSQKYHPEHPIQAWTSDMWAVFWNAIYFGHEVKISKAMEFSWGSDHIKRWRETNIFHNAGVVTSNGGTHFYKIDYQISPFNKELKSNDDNCTFNYINEIKDTELNFADILF